MPLLMPTRRQLIAAAPAILAARLPARVVTGAADRVLRFLVVGDWGRRGSDYQRHVASLMRHEAANRGARFVLTTGDNFYNFGVSDKQSSHWKESWLDIYGDLVRKPWYPVLGNHDYAGNAGAQLGDYPGTGWHMPASSYVIRGANWGHPEVDLFMLDTVMWKGGNDFPQGWFGQQPPRGAEQAVKAWLDTALGQSNAAVKLVFGHHPIYSVGPHGGALGLPDLDAMLKCHRVTAYVCGHDHCLYHIQHDGLDYICSGGGSEELSHYKGGRTYRCVIEADCPEGSDLPGGAPHWRGYYDRAGFAVFEVSRSAARFHFVDRDGVELHRRELPIRAAGACAAPSSA